MSAEAKKSMAWSAVLIVLGVVALYSDVQLLAILVPAAVFVYYGSKASRLHSRVRQGLKIDAEWDNRPDEERTSPIVPRESRSL